LASCLASSTVHGDPYLPMVTLRRGAARPLPARYTKTKDLAQAALTRSPKPLTAPSHSVYSRGRPSGPILGAAASHCRLVSTRVLFAVMVAVRATSMLGR
jgi:hypothetical protein